jgi:signal transduction histidine kinase
MRRRSPIPITVSLTRQFALTGSVIMLLAMIAAGFFTAEIVTKATVENTASSTALLIDSFLEPMIQGLASEELLPVDQTSELNRLLKADHFKERFPHLDIWKEGGLIVYSTAPDLIGRRFTPSPGLIKALAGDVSAQYADLNALEHRFREINRKYLEIYVPIREERSGRVVAAAEIHESTAPLQEKLWSLRLKSWLAVAGATALIMAGLFGIVYRGNKLIRLQQRQLHERLVEIEHTSQHNHILKERAQRASGRVAELTENNLRRIGADLHDGPAQLISLAALTVEHVRRAQTPTKHEEELQLLNSVLSEALHDIRTMSKGLMLPEIEDLPIPEIIKRVASSHERRTGTKVAVHCSDISHPLTHGIKICAYRFLQEGLNNAFRHAGGNGQVVTCGLDDSVLNLVVQDDGGAGIGGHASADAGLGLFGMRERVESLGGIFKLTQLPRGGTRIEMSVVVAEGPRDG